MYPVIFLNESDLSKVYSILNARIDEWLSSWSLLDSVNVTVESIKYNEIPKENLGQYYIKDSLLTLIVDERAFDWASFVFSELKSMCPRDIVMKDIIDSIKECFFDSACGEGRYSSEFLSKTNPLTAIDSYLKVSISDPIIGTIVFYGSHSYFSTLIGKKNESKSIGEICGRYSVISSLNVKMNFEFDFGEILFKDIVAMNVGTIFTSSEKIKNDFFSSVNSIRVANVAMGKKQNSIAFLMKERNHG